VVFVVMVAAPGAAVAMVAAIVRRCRIVSRRGASHRGHGCGAHHWDRRRETHQQDRGYRCPQELRHVFHFESPAKKFHNLPLLKHMGARLSRKKIKWVDQLFHSSGRAGL